MKYRIYRPEKLSGRVPLPPSKSLSNRALILNALSGAPLGYLSNISDCDDTVVMLEALFLLDAEQHDHKVGQLVPTINIKAAGTAMRFLTAYLCALPQTGTRIITGTERMQQRPIAILVDALRELGAKIEYMGQEGFPPLRITGVHLRGGKLSLSGSVSSQYISALLMIAPLLKEGLRLRLKGEVVSRPYINMTIAMMRHYGAHVKWQGPRVIAVQPGAYRPTPFYVEGDWSAASYWFEMSLLNRQRSDIITLLGLFPDSLQGDSAVAEIFRPLSVVAFSTHHKNEWLCQLVRQGRPAGHLEWDFTKTPDLAQTLVVTCAMTGVPFRFTGLQSLRIKETDRIAALQTELRKLGVQIEVEGDSVIYWNGPKRQAKGDVPYLHPAPDTVIETYDDHRMAMAFAPTALMLDQIDIHHPEVVSKSYPTFWEDLIKAGFKIEELEKYE